MSLPTWLGKSLILGKEDLSGFQCLAHKKACTTVMRLVVKVPVLSEQMVVALPMVSQASKCRTRLLSAIIFFTEYAKERVTARGRPSGTATTKTVTPMMTNLKGKKRYWNNNANTDRRKINSTIFLPDVIINVRNVPRSTFRHKVFDGILDTQYNHGEK